MDPTQQNPYVAVMNPRARLIAQEQMAAGQQPMPIPQPAPAMSQAQFSGYQAPGMQPMPGRPPMTPQQIQQLAALLQARQQ